MTPRRIQAQRCFPSLSPGPHPQSRYCKVAVLKALLVSSRSGALAQLIVGHSQCAEESSSRKTQLLSMVSVVLAMVLVFYNLGGGSIDLADESITAGRSLAFYHHGNIFELSVNGELSMRKPPLLYMLNALSFSILGVNEFSLRFFNALFGFLTFLLIAYAADRLYGRTYAALAILLLCGSSSFIEYSREALTDTAFVFGVTLTLVAIAFALERERIETAHKVAYGAGLFIAALSKGFFALIVPTYAALFLLLAQRRFVVALIVPSALALLPLLAWVAGALLMQPNFYRDFFQQELYERLNPHSTYLPLHQHGPLWYLKKLWDWYGLTGYFGLGGAAMWIIWCVRNRGSRRAAKGQPVIEFFAGFALFFLFAISLSSHKRDAYILPIFPALAVLMAATLARLENAADQPAQRRQQIYRGIVALAVSAGLLRTLMSNEPIPDYRPQEKQLALAVATLNVDDIAVVTDAPRVAPILHFYLDRVIPVATSSDAVFESPAWLVSREEKVGARRVGSYFLSRVEKK